MTNTLLRNLDLFRNLCGSNALSNVILVTTNWDQLQTIDEGIRNEAELRRNYWQPLLDSGSQMLRFEYTCSSAWNIIDSLPMDQKPLEIQREMVDEKKPLYETAAGRSLVSWFHRATETLRQLIHRLELLIKKVTTSSDMDDTVKRKREEELKNAKEKANTDLRRIQEQQSRLFYRRSNPSSVRSSNESSLSGDSNSSGSLWRYVVHKMYDKPENGIRRRLSRLKPRRAQTFMANIGPSGSSSPEPLCAQNAVCDIPNADSFVEVATGQDVSTSTGSLTCTIQALKLACSAVSGIPIPGLRGAVGVALRIAETLSVSLCMAST